MITIIPLSDTRIYEAIEFIRKCLDMNGDTESNLLQFENRILYEFILR